MADSINERALRICLKSKNKKNETDENAGESLHNLPPPFFLQVTSLGQTQALIKVM